MYFNEINNNIQSMNSAWQEYKSLNDQRLANIEKNRSIDPLITEQLSNIGNSIDEYKDRIAKLEISASRPYIPGESYANHENSEHKNAFLGYLKKGIEKNLSQFEKKSMSAGSNEDGGYLITPQMSKSVIKTLTQFSPVRQLASTETISTDSLDILEDKDIAQAGWTTETGVVSDTKTPKINIKRIHTHELYAQPKATQKLLDDANIDVEKWLINKLVDIFAATENKSFINGDGNGKPRGILSYENGKEWGKIQQINSGKAAAITAESIFNIYFALKDVYASRATFLMNRNLLQSIRMLKNETTGEYLWNPSIVSGTPSTLLGVPVMDSSDMPNPDKESLSLVLADFKAAYKIVDRMGVRVLRDPYTEKPFVKFYATKRVGADVTNFEAIKIMKLA